MEYRNLGKSGLQVSVAGLGCNNFGMRIDYAKSEQVVNQAIDLGVNLFDTANISGGGGVSEEFLGKALGGRRQDVIVATKFGGKMGEGPHQSGGSAVHVKAAVEDSLRRLGTDYIDLYQLHFPDPKTPIDETLRALDDLVRAGKVRYIGHSNFTPAMAVEADWIARTNHLTPFVSGQNEYNLLNRSLEKEFLPVSEKYGLGQLPYFPLASGFLTGKYRQGEQPPEGTRLAAWAPLAKNILTDDNYAKLDQWEGFARERDHSLLDLAMGWLASNPVISSVIAGATSPEQVQANVSAAEWRLTADERAAL